MVGAVGLEEGENVLGPSVVGVVGVLDNVGLEEGCKVVGCVVVGVVGLEDG